MFSTYCVRDLNLYNAQKKCLRLYYGYVKMTKKKFNSHFFNVVFVY